MPLLVVICLLGAVPGLANCRPRLPRILSQGQGAR